MVFEKKNSDITESSIDLQYEKQKESTLRLRISYALKLQFAGNLLVRNVFVRDATFGNFMTGTFLARTV